MVTESSTPDRSFQKRILGYWGLQFQLRYATVEEKNHRDSLLQTDLMKKMLGFEEFQLQLRYATIEEKDPKYSLLQTDLMKKMLGYGEFQALLLTPLSRKSHGDALLQTENSHQAKQNT
ncbi:hypothetical protein JTB14_004146 [Gonioctena quinquepunctata]|nr:hypothetical protein JTB14_004146 [Gonioctena quinquepunctata]